MGRLNGNKAQISRKLYFKSFSEVVSRGIFLCILFFSPLLRWCMFAAIISGLRPVELPFQIFFSGNLPGCQLLFAKLPFQQKLVQQVVAETDGYVFFREVRVCIFVYFIKPDARVSERKNRVRDNFSAMQVVRSKWKVSKNDTLYCSSSMQSLRRLHGGRALG